MKMKKIARVLLVIFALIFFFRFIIGGDEDEWICQEGEWIQHGNPSAPKPTTDCE